MATTPGATELLGIPQVGRTYSATRVVRLGDVDTSGQLRFDAAARYLQDVATADAGDAKLDDRFGWVVRRTMIDVVSPPQLDEPLTITTYCTGLGRSWAERTTQLDGDGGGFIRSVSLWVQVDTETGRPSALTPQFLDIYGSACDGRKVSPRLSLPGPSDPCTSRPWPIRRVDLDPFDHVNNAANWAFVEETADFVRAGRPRTTLAEMEFVLPVGSDANVDLVRAEAASPTFDMWLTDGGAVLSAARLTARSTNR